MKILVCISHVPDTTSKINFVNNDTEFDTNGVQYVINPNDEFGLTKAIILKEQNGAHVTVVNVGGTDAEATLRKALAIGADEAIRVNTNPTDGLFVAKQLENVVKQGGYDLKIVLENSNEIAEVKIYGGKTSKKNNPAIDILRKIWERKKKRLMWYR